MTRLTWEAMPDECAREEIREWLRSQDLTLVDSVLIRPSSISFVFSFGIRLRVTAMTSTAQMEEISSCCAARLDRPVHKSYAHLYCARCLAVEQLPGPQRNPLGLLLGANRTCVASDLLAEAFRALGVQEIIESAGVNVLISTIAVSALADLLSSCPQIFGFNPSEQGKEV